MQLIGKLALVAFVLVLSACGGSDDPPTAADCFNPQLFTAGTQYKLDYRISGSLPGTQAEDIRVQASPASGPSDVVVATDFTITHDVPVTHVTDLQRTRDVQAIDGRDILTRAHYEMFSNTAPDEIPTTYQPPLRDQRYSLAQGASFSLVRNIAQAGSTTTYSTTITYLGQESVTVPAGTFTACKFEERYDDGSGSVIDTWVIKGKGVLVKSVSAAGTQELVDLGGL